MPSIGTNSKPAYVYDAGTDTWIPIGPGEHTHDYIGKDVITTTGDLIYASAANTPARRGIGSTGQVLTVSGGLPTWAAPAVSSYAWTTYTPTLNQITLGNGEVSGRYVEIATGTIAFHVFFSPGSTTSFTSSYAEISLPFATRLRQEFLGHYWDNSATTLRPFTSPVVSNGGSNISLRALTTNSTYAEYTSFSSGAPIPWANNDYFIVKGVYEKN